MSAIRLARGFTGRKFVIKFEGCYHGHADALLVKAGSGVATLGIPGSAGVPEETAMHTLALPYNDLAAVRSRLRSASGPDRLHHRRAGRRQRRNHPARSPDTWTGCGGSRGRTARC